MSAPRNKMPERKPALKKAPPGDVIDSIQPQTAEPKATELPAAPANPDSSATADALPTPLESVPDIKPNGGGAASQTEEASRQQRSQVSFPASSDTEASTPAQSAEDPAPQRRLRPGRRANRRSMLTFSSSMEVGLRQAVDDYCLDHGYTLVDLIDEALRERLELPPYEQGSSR